MKDYEFSLCSSSPKKLLAFILTRLSALEGMLKNENLDPDHEVKRH